MSAEPSLSSSSARIKQHLIIQILRCRGLQLNDKGKSDPYVWFSRGSKSFRTSTVAKSTEPQWDAARFKVSDARSDRDDTLDVQVWDRNRLQRDDFRGHVLLLLRPFLGAPASERWYPLEAREKKKDKVSGEILLRIEPFVSLSSARLLPAASVPILPLPSTPASSTTTNGATTNNANPAASFPAPFNARSPVSPLSPPASPHSPPASPRSSTALPSPCDSISTPHQKIDPTSNYRNEHPLISPHPETQSQTQTRSNHNPVDGQITFDPKNSSAPTESNLHQRRHINLQRPTFTLNQLFSILSSYTCPLFFTLLVWILLLRPSLFLPFSPFSSSSSSSLSSSTNRSEADSSTIHPVISMSLIEAWNYGYATALASISSASSSSSSSSSSFSSSNDCRLPASPWPDSSLDQLLSIHASLLFQSQRQQPSIPSFSSSLSSSPTSTTLLITWYLSVLVIVLTLLPVARRILQAPAFARFFNTFKDRMVSLGFSRFRLRRFAEAAAYLFSIWLIGSALELTPGGIGRELLLTAAALLSLPALFLTLHHSNAFAITSSSSSSTSPLSAIPASFPSYIPPIKHNLAFAILCWFTSFLLPLTCSSSSPSLFALQLVALFLAASLMSSFRGLLSQALSLPFSLQSLLSLLLVLSRLTPFPILPSFWGSLFINAIWFQSLLSASASHLSPFPPLVALLCSLLWSFFLRSCPHFHSLVAVFACYAAGRLLRAAFSNGFAVGSFTLSSVILSTSFLFTSSFTSSLCPFDSY